MADAVVLVAAAAVLADIVAAAVTGTTDVGQVSGRIVLLLLLQTGRGGLAWLTAALPQRAAAKVKARLRAEIVGAATGPHRGSAAATGELVAVAVRGLDALDPYFARYLPELIRAATVPVVVVVAMLSRDVTSGLIVAATLPLIPLFGALVGAYTARRTARQWRVLAVLSHHFLDVVRGLPTLKVFGRAKAQATNIARVSDQHRAATMATLRVALLSALVLELAATLSVALVAVSVGLRLVYGGLDLRVALFLLILAPEAYLPWRRMATEYHAAAEGLAAAERAFAVIEGAEPSAPSVPPPDPRRLALTLAEVTVRYPERELPAVDGVNLVIPPRQVTAIVGPSGCGKSTLMSVLLGLCTPDAGRVLVGDTDLSTVELSQWYQRLAWLPEHPQFVAGTVRDNIMLGRPDATDRDVQSAAAAAKLAVPLDSVPDLLSTGERQRIALARVFLRRDASLLLLDEPTGHLDPETEEDICAVLEDFARGRTVVLVTHRPAPLRLADAIVDLSAVTVS